MADEVTKVDFQFQVNQTDFHVSYSNPTQLIADAIISSDDIYLSASSGVSKMIWERAGVKNVRREMRKLSIPAPLGSVLLTGAGRLKSKYILHVAALDFTIRSDPRYIVPHITRQVLDIANALNLESLVTPSLVVRPSAPNETSSLVSQLSGYSEVKLIELLLRAMACHLSMKESSIKKITLVIYDNDSKDHQASEKQFAGELAELIAQVDDWKKKSEPINSRLVHLIPLLELSGDEVFTSFIRNNVASNREELHGIFNDPDLILPENKAPDNTLDRQELIQREDKLKGVLEDFDQQISSQEDLKKAHQKRLHERELQGAAYGVSADPSIVDEINDIPVRIEECEADIKQLKSQKEVAERDMENIKHMLTS